MHRLRAQERTGPSHWRLRRCPPPRRRNRGIHWGEKWLWAGCRAGARQALWKLRLPCITGASLAAVVLIATALAAAATAAASMAAASTGVVQLLTASLAVPLAVHLRGRSWSSGSTKTVLTTQVATDGVYATTMPRHAVATEIIHFSSAIPLLSAHDSLMSSVFSFVSSLLSLLSSLCSVSVPSPRSSLE